MVWASSWPQSRTQSPDRGGWPRGPWAWSWGWTRPIQSWSVGALVWTPWETLQNTNTTLNCYWLQRQFKLQLHINRYVSCGRQGMSEWAHWPAGSSVTCLGTNSGQFISWEKSVCVWLGRFMPGRGHFSGSTFRRIFMSISSTSLLSFKA